MLFICLGFLGPKFPGVTKPLTFGLTPLSIVAGCAWVLKRSRKAKAKNVNTGLHEDAGAEPGQV